MESCAANLPGSDNPSLPCKSAHFTGFFHSTWQNKIQDHWLFTQVRQAVVGMNDCAGEAERRIYHPWDRLSSGGSGKVRMIPGNVLQPGVTCLLFCFTIRIKHVNHTFCHFYFITNNCRDTQLFFSPITVLLLNAESVMHCSFYDRDKR